MQDKIHIKTESGETVEAQAPIIISASRSTDIPAYYAQWFINRLKAGYAVWYNPFNQKPMYVSFKHCKVVVFWTKNPEPLMPLLHELDSRGINYYFQFSLNDYEKESFEPNIPSLKKRIDVFKTLSDLIGKDKVIWRYDPIIITQLLPPREILRRIWQIGNQLKGYTNKLVFSFIDINGYQKVQRNLVKESEHFTKETVADSELSIEQIHEISVGLTKIRDRWSQESWDIKLATCAENIDLEGYSIEHNRCIDGEFMKEIFPDDTELLHYLKYGKLPQAGQMLWDEVNPKEKSIEKFKDKGQRKSCGCMISKDIGMYNTCCHFCIYCYANTSKETVLKNRQLHSLDHESIIIQL